VLVSRPAPSTRTASSNFIGPPSPTSPPFHPPSPPPQPHTAHSRPKTLARCPPDAPIRPWTPPDAGPEASSPKVRIARAAKSPRRTPSPPNPHSPHEVRTTVAGGAARLREQAAGEQKAQPPSRGSVRPSEGGPDLHRDAGHPRGRCWYLAALPPISCPSKQAPAPCSPNSWSSGAQQRMVTRPTVQFDVTHMPSCAADSVRTGTRALIYYYRTRRTLKTISLKTGSPTIRVQSRQRQVQ